MNVLFANYGDFTSNSLNHIATFARALSDLGHACAVAVPEGRDTLAAVPEPHRFSAHTFAEVLAADAPAPFPDGRAADVLHAWTPRENVREFALRYLQSRPQTTFVVHLEDNEDHLAAVFTQRSVELLRAAPDEETGRALSARLSHPDRSRQLLRLAHGVTHITTTLAAELSGTQPRLLLEPGVDAAIFHPQPPDAALRGSLGLRPDERVIVYPGGTNFANLGDIRTLLEAIALLRSRDHPVRLVRTGIHPAQLDEQLGRALLAPVLDLGFIERARLGPLLALADVLVQPGTPGPYNDLRLPSKLPEFLASGRSVVLPRSNIGLELTDGAEALLHDGSAASIATACERVFRDPTLATRLGAAGAAFAQRRFGLAHNTARLAAFYAQLHPPAVPVFSSETLPASDDILYARAIDPLLGRRMAAKEHTVHRLTHAVEETQQRLAQLHSAHTVLQQQASATQAALAATEARLATTRHELTNLQAIAAHAAAQVHARDDELAATRRQLAQVRDKLDRTLASGSWRYTAPARALRRLLVDPFRPRATTPAPGLAHRSAPEGFRFSLDQPADLTRCGLSTVFQGWVLDLRGRTIDAVRLLAADGTVSAGHYGTPRPDVALQFRGASATTGFALSHRFPTAGRHIITLEARLAPDTWERFATLTLDATPGAGDVVAYPDWIQVVERTAPPPALPAQSDALATDEGAPGPRFSILVPVYNTAAPWLRRCLESVLAQTYPRWELCLADDASPAAHVRTILAEFAARDARIKVTHREANGHICAATNSALELATGDFLALLDHDDELHPEALAHVAAAVATYPETGYLYTDEDKIDEHGRRFDPHLKPAWNPELLCGQNYGSHLSVFRTDRVRALGGFRAGTEGSQDWDLVLRVTEQLAPTQIVHVPRVLYHWRAIPGSTATGHDQKDYASTAAARVLRDHLARTGVAGAEVLPVIGGHWHIRRPRPEPAPLVSIIIPTRDALPLVRLCLDSLRLHTTYPRYEILLVDNGSRDPGALAAFADYAKRELIRLLPYDRPFNYSAINNWAAAQARGEILIFLNNDIEVRDGTWLDELVAHAVRPEIGCVGARLLYPSGTVQHDGVILGIAGPRGVDGVAGHPFKGLPREAHGYFNRAQLAQNVSAVTAACLAIRAEVFRQVGGFDERDLAVAFNDVDLCLKVLAAGYRNLWTPFAELVHHESATRGAEDTPEKVARFNREVDVMRTRWGQLLDADPAYHPLLTLVHEDFSLAWPLRPGVDLRPRAGEPAAPVVR